MHRLDPPRSVPQRLAPFAILLLTACGGDESSTPPASPISITLFHTTDEHGWLEADTITEPGLVAGGAANIRAVLADEGFDPSRHLLISGGDNWTGPAISTWVEGESAMEVFNAFGYAASAIGNHEFDFDVDVFEKRVGEASFPYLSANILDRATQERPSWATPYVVLESDGVRVGIIGLTTTKTSTSGHPRYVSELEFTDYVEALETYVPLATADGADVVVVLAHVCGGSLAEAVAEADVHVDVALAGHCHALEIESAGDVKVVSSGAHFAAFSRLDITLDGNTRDVTAVDVRQVPVGYLASQDNPVTPDPDVKALVDKWSTTVSTDLATPVGHAATGFERGSWSMGNWITDAWLAEHPEADVAFVNHSSIRSDLAAGDFTLAEMVGIMPFKNELITLELSGEEIAAILADGAPFGSGDTGKFAIAGTSYSNPLEPQTAYTVITTDFLYFGGSGAELQSLDAEPTFTGDLMRDPVARWSEALATSASDPIEDHIDAAPRN